MAKIHAAVDIGSHTARLLVARESGISGVIDPIARKRAYIRLAEGFNQSGDKIITPVAMDRALNVLHDFSSYINCIGVNFVHAVATGVIREASNRDAFLDRIYEYTGIRARTITGIEEAVLTAKGALHELNIHTSPFVVFDLGGGSTEFLIGSGCERVARSVPLGASTMTKKYFRSDPPEGTQVNTLLKHVDRCLNASNLNVPGARDSSLLVGTGGTVTTLAVMIHGIPLENMSAGVINGLILKRCKIEALFNEMKDLSLGARLKLPGLDKGRAGVILAGCLMVLRILSFFRSVQLTVSMSDLLEGLLFENFEGKGND